MPLDEFYVYSPELDNYAEQLLIAKCLTGAGYQWPVPWRDTTFPWGQDFNTVGLRLFNIETAKQWGYHLAPPRSDAELREADAWSNFRTFANSYEPDAKFDSKFDECRKAARSKVTLTNVDGATYVGALGNQASQLADQSAPVQKAINDWRTCLSSKVSFVVPASPSRIYEMPVVEQFGLSGPNKTSSASAEEIRVAVADASCRETSGYAQSLYDAEWSQQEQLVEKNRDKLDRLRSHAVAQKKQLLQIVAENAPLGQ